MKPKVTVRMEIKKSVGNRKDKSRSIKPINLHSDNTKKKITYKLPISEMAEMTSLQLLNR